MANQEGDANGLYRQANGRFDDVAAAAGVAGTPRPKEDGGVGPSVADVDLDGDFDLFVANYGPSALYRADAAGTFTDIARGSGIDLRGHGVTSAWGDVDNDGRPDLYVGNFIAGQPLDRDAFFLNLAARFVDVLPDALLTHDATHGVRFADFDGDGRLDLSLTNNDPAGGGHPLWRNIATPRGRSLAIDVTDRNARRTRAALKCAPTAPALANCCRRAWSIREAATVRRARRLSISACRNRGRGTSTARSSRCSPPRATSASFAASIRIAMPGAPFA